jgi:peptidoglycan/LPS O-acetylase OafA/YrhL
MHLLCATAFTLLAWMLSIKPVGLLVNRATCYLGKVSFSAYLTHFAALDVASRLLGIDHLANLPRSAFCDRFVPELLHAASWSGPARLVFLIGAVLPMTLLLSTATYHLIEEPGVRLGKWMIRTAGW